MTSRSPYVVIPRCGIDDCHREIKARGMCETHYKAWREAGQLEHLLTTWTGSDQGTHARCGGHLVGLFTKGLPWAQCDRCGLKGEPV